MSISDPAPIIALVILFVTFVALNWYDSRKGRMPPDE